MSKRYRTELVLKIFPSIPKGVFGGGRLTRYLEKNLFYREFHFSPWKLAFSFACLALLAAWSLTSLALSWHAVHRAEAMREELAEREQDLREERIQVSAARRDYFLLLSRLAPLNEKVDRLGDFSRQLGMVAGLDSLAEEMGVRLEERAESLELSEDQVAELDRRFELIGTYVANQEFELSRTPSISPLKDTFVPTDRFGYRVLRGQGGARDAWGGKDRSFHAGLDLAAPTGTPIYAPADATVHFAGRVPRKQSPRVALYGNFVVLDHGTGIRTVYAHCDRLNVATGDGVSRGELIAWVGSTGRSTGPHLHYEVVANGRPVDPELFIMDVAIPQKRVRVDSEEPSLVLEEVDRLLGL